MTGFIAFYEIGLHFDHDSGAFSPDKLGCD
jgi:hypothetical protein